MNSLNDFNLFLFIFIYRFATDVIFSTAFGVNSQSLENPKSEFRYYAKKILEVSPVKIALAFFAPQILDLLKIPLIERSSSKFFIKVFTEAFERRVKNNVRKTDFLDLLIQLVNTGHLEEDDESETATISGINLFLSTINKYSLYKINL